MEGGLRPQIQEYSASIFPRILLLLEVEKERNGTFLVSKRINGSLIEVKVLSRVLLILCSRTRKRIYYSQNR